MNNITKKLLLLSIVPTILLSSTLGIAYGIPTTPSSELNNSKVEELEHTVYEKIENPAWNSVDMIGDEFISTDFNITITQQPTSKIDPINGSDYVAEIKFVIEDTNNVFSAINPPILTIKPANIMGSNYHLDNGEPTQVTYTKYEDREIELTTTDNVVWEGTTIVSSFAFWRINVLDTNATLLEELWFESQGYRTSYLPMKTNLAAQDLNQDWAYYNYANDLLKENGSLESVMGSSHGWYDFSMDFRDATLLQNYHIDKDLLAPKGNHYDLNNWIVQPDNHWKVTSLWAGGSDSSDKFIPIGPVFYNTDDPTNIWQQFGWYTLPIKKIELDKNNSFFTTKDSSYSKPVITDFVDPTLNFDAPITTEITDDGYFYLIVHDLFYIPEGSNWSVVDENEEINRSYLVIENDINGDGDITPIYLPSGDELDTTLPEEDLLDQLNEIDSFSSMDGETRVVFPSGAPWDNHDTPFMHWGYSTPSDPQYNRYLTYHENTDFYLNFYTLPPIHIIGTVYGLISLVGIVWLASLMTDDKIRQKTLSIIKNPMEWLKQ